MIFCTVSASNFLEGCGRFQGAAGIIHQNVDAAKIRYDGPHRADHRGFVRHIAADGDRSGKRLRDFLRGPRLQIKDGDFCPSPASRQTMARPMPFAAPVTILFSNRFISSQPYQTFRITLNIALR